METSCLHLLLSRRGKAAHGEVTSLTAGSEMTSVAVLYRMVFVRTGGKFLSECWHEALSCVQQDLF